MAVVTSTVITKGAGSIGNITVRSRKGGGLIVSGKATIVANPRTDAQVFQRTRFNNINTFAKGLLLYLNSYWTRSKPNVAPIAEFASIASKSFDPTWNTIQQIASSVLQVGKGNLSQFVNLSFTDFAYDAPNKKISCKANWSDALFGNAAANDEIFFVLLNATKGQIEGVLSATPRSAKTLTPEFNLTYVEDVYVVAYYCTNATKTIWADSFTMGVYEAGAFDPTA